jgi:lipoate-protein ligase A
VFHGEDLIFSLVARYEGGQALLSSVQTSYAKIHEGVKMGLESCGLDPEFYGHEDALPKGNDCFDFPVTSDLSWKGKKIAGGAQKRSNGVLLHHESIQVPPGVGREELLRAVRHGLEKVFGVEIQNAELDPELYFQAEKLKETTDCGLQTAV